MKLIKTIGAVILIIILIAMVDYFFLSKFKEGECIINKDDGYIWQINGYSGGEYRAMGWQENAWGNAVNFYKTILERKDTSGIYIYKVTTCPEFKVK